MRAGYPRVWVSRWARLALIGAVGMVLAPTLTVSAQARSEPFPGRFDAAAASASASASFPFSTRHVRVQMVHGRIVASATILNTGHARVRSSTGALGLISGSGGSATGVQTFSVPSLPGRSSRAVRFTTGRLRDLPLRSGTVTVVLCTDVDSQVGRFSPSRNCVRGGALAIGTAAVAEASGPVPNTVMRTASTSASPTAAFGFDSSSAGSEFQCSLDGGPWLACRRSRRYTGLVDGRHSFAVRAISRTGRPDPTPAHVAWTVDSDAPEVTLQNPVTGSTTSDDQPTFSGTAGTRATDSSSVTVKLFSGSSASGLPIQTLTTSRSGARWSVATGTPIANGTYTARAQQSNRAGDTGVSAPSTFTIHTPLTPQTAPLTTYSVGGTVSGLSGTLVLQDNGGDDLSVAGNGSFTFGTQLGAGGLYEVTIKTAPSLQDCAVADGAGTVGGANVTTVAVTCVPSGQLGADDFNRADGALGAGWAPIGDGGLSIGSQHVSGTKVAANAGDVRVAENYPSDQYSQLEVTSNSLGPDTTGDAGAWIGPAVRSQNGGQNLYVGIYFWNNGNPQLQLYRRHGGQFTQLGGNYDCRPAAGGHSADAHRGWLDDHLGGERDQADLGHRHDADRRRSRHRQLWRRQRRQLVWRRCEQAGRRRRPSHCRSNSRATTQTASPTTASTPGTTETARRSSES